MDRRRAARAWRRGATVLMIVLVTASTLAARDGDSAASPPNFCGDQAAVFRGAHAYLGISDGTVQAASPRLRDCALGQMAAHGIGLYRGEINWAGTEYTPGRYDFSGSDALVSAVARHHMHLLVTLMGAPRWRSTNPSADKLDNYPPASPVAFGHFAALCAQRYGPHGTFWRENAKLPYEPVSGWEVWNEPNLSGNWIPRPNPAAYVRLLQGAYRAIKHVDRRATVITGGMPFRGIADETSFLTKMYRAHMRGYFDALSIHPYSVSLSGAYQRLVAARSVMQRFRDARKPLWVTEVGWSGGNPNGFITDPRKQRTQLGAFFEWVRQHRRGLRLQRVIWYGWMDVAVGGRVSDPAWWGYHLGMFTTTLRPKPVLSALATAARRLDR